MLKLIDLLRELQARFRLTFDYDILPEDFSSWVINDFTMQVPKSEVANKFSLTLPIIASLTGRNWSEVLQLPKAVFIAPLSLAAEYGGQQLRQHQHIILVLVPQVAPVLAAIAQIYFNYQAEQTPPIVAFTGTNGKTSCALLTAKLLSLVQPSAEIAYIGTLGQQLLAWQEQGNTWQANTLPNCLAAPAMTTPDLPTLYKILAKLSLQQHQACCLEVSSHALAQDRIFGLAIKIAVFTNFSQDHLDYHGSMADYWAAKQKLFFDYQPKIIITNLDDPKGYWLFAEAELSAELIIGYTLSAERSQHICQQSKPLNKLKQLEQREQLKKLEQLEQHKPPKRLLAQWHQAELKIFSLPAWSLIEQHALQIPGLIGWHNYQNYLASMLAAWQAQGGGPAELTAVLQRSQAALAAGANLLQVAGRMEWVRPDLSQRFGLPLVCVDYAHTPDALLNVLQSLRAALPAYDLWLVFGCGGDRDRGKRSQMLTIGLQYADYLILTEDNSRSEQLVDIWADMLDQRELPHNCRLIADRAQAISQAITQSRQQAISQEMTQSRQPAKPAVVLIAGKGHETWQESRGQRVFFSDQESAAAVLANFS